MDFRESELQTELRDLARKFAEKEIMPIVNDDERTETFRPEIIQKLGDLGLTGIAVSEEYGGAGLGYLEYSAVLEEIAKASTSYAISIAVSGLPMVILDLFGTQMQKKKYIPPLAAGKAIGAFSLSEAGSGSDAASLRTTAEKKGSHYVLNGTKLWCTQADVADTIMVMARTGEEGAKGVSAFIVEKNTKGLKLGKREKKMGCSISHTMELIFDNVEIPLENRVGAEGEGFIVAMKALDGGRITIAATAVGVAQGALDIAVNYSMVREQFHKPIAMFQGVGFMLANAKTQIDASRLLVHKAASIRDKGEDFAVLASEAKVHATDCAMQVTIDAVQILGGAGYTTEFPVERYMREAKVLQIVEGTNQIQRLIIARHLTGLKF